MTLVGVQGLVAGDIECHAGAFKAPRMSCIPITLATVVLGSVFKVAVLNEFGIQAAVGAVVNVLEEDAYQLVGD